MGIKHSIWRRVIAEDIAIGPLLTPAVAGCIELQGDSLTNRRVRLAQPNEPTPMTVTNAVGCYDFEDAISGKSGRVIISLPVVP